jgi:broad specificity phosphatase PhoE
MRIGLIRHFPVRLKLPTGWRTEAELQAWIDEYDLAETDPIAADLGGIAWQACICSDLPRAHFTATTLFSGPVERTALLREARFALFGTGNLRLPIWLWEGVLRITWLGGHGSQRPSRDAFRQRIRAAADRISALEMDTLIVSHAGTMAYLSKELRARGFAGPKLRLARHAAVYLYVRANGASRKPRG